MTRRIRHVGEMTSTKEVITFAKRNGGIFSTQEALALGMVRATLHRRVADGVFVRVGQGLYALPGTATRPDLAMRAAHRLLEAVVSHQSAARIHGFEPIGKSPPSVTVSHRGTHSFPGVIVHQATDLLEEHVIEIDGLRVTTPLRTLVDLAKVLRRPQLERVIEHALVTGKVKVGELVDMVAALSRQGKKGFKNLHSIIDERLVGTAKLESELERILLRLIVDAGLPTPVKQFRAPWLKRRKGRVDLAYPDKCILIEGDSRRWHGLFDAFEVDRVRDNAAQIAGWIVLRFTWRMIKDEPSTVIRTIREAIELRG